MPTDTNTNKVNRARPMCRHSCISALLLVLMLCALSLSEGGWNLQGGQVPSQPVTPLLLKSMRVLFLFSSSIMN